MKKCPHCGSTAQFRLISIFYADKYIEISYKCGCCPKETVLVRLSYEQYQLLKEREEQHMEELVMMCLIAITVSYAIRTSR